MITLSLDVTLLDKARFKTITRSNGKKAVFCDLVLIETPQGKYGDYMVKQSCTKEERAAKKEMPILGNGRLFEPQGSRRPPPKAPTTPTEPEESPTDDVPF